MKELKILFVGNSFALDTAEHAPNIALSLGISKVKFGTLFVGGCSIDMHYSHLCDDEAVYTYYTNEGNGWSTTPEYRISKAVRGEAWDWIIIQHGTHDGSRYTSSESYARLGELVRGIRTIAPEGARIGFNLTWLGESTRQHPEIISYRGDMAAMRKRLVEVTREAVLTVPDIDLLVPTGTAIENARTSRIGLLTRDCYHLSMDKGRYIAGLTLVASVTGLPIDGIAWMPEGVDGYSVRVAIEAAKRAVTAPLEVTQLSLPDDAEQ